jgi:hypothetical protein
MNKILLASILSVFIITISACTKDESPSEILTGQKWRIAVWNVNPAIDIAGTKYTDITSVVAACTKDNFIEFRSDKSIIEDEGATKCNSTDPQSGPAGKWDLSEDGKSLYLTDTDLSGLTGTIQATVNRLDKSELNISLSVSLSNQQTTLTLSLLPN